MLTGSGWKKLEFTQGKDAFIHEMARLGHPLAGEHESPRTREILQGQPVFSGILGPMYDGEGWVRYENQDAYDSLSS
jgi:hypothetical protein